MASHRVSTRDEKKATPHLVKEGRILQGIMVERDRGGVHVTPQSHQKLGFEVMSLVPGRTTSWSLPVSRHPVDHPCAFYDHLLGGQFPIL